MESNTKMLFYLQKSQEDIIPSKIQQQEGPGMMVLQQASKTYLLKT